MKANEFDFFKKYDGRKKYDTTYLVTTRDIENILIEIDTCVDISKPEQILPIELNKKNDQKTIDSISINLSISGESNSELKDSLNNQTIENSKLIIEVANSNDPIIKFENKINHNMGQDLLGFCILFASVSYLIISYTAWISFYKEIRFLFK